MIINLGILSVLQMAIIPGLIVTRLMKIRGFLTTLLVALGLSTIVNYLFVFAFTAAGIYNRKTVLGFVIVELLITVVLLIPIIKQPVSFSRIKTSIQRFVTEFVNPDNKSKLVINLFALIAASGVLVYYFIHYSTDYTSVFSTWDAVVSWNRWAGVWYQNQIPLDSGHYPQLMPANWSFAYLMIGDDRVQFFAKYFMGLVEIFIPLTLWIIGYQQRKPGYFFGTALAGWLQLKLGSQGSGYMDTPVTFFAILVLFILLQMEKNPRNANKYILLGAIFAAGAGITKQSGLWIAGVYPILFIYLQRKKLAPHGINPFLQISLLYLLILVPWYAFVQYRVWFGQASSEIPYITTLASQDKSFFQTIANGFNLLFLHLAKIKSTGMIAAFILTLLMVFSIFDKWCRRILVFIVVPWFILWLVLFSYDIRNINLIVPFAGLSAGFGLEFLLARLGQFFSNPLDNLMKKIRGSWLGRVFSPLGLLSSYIKSHLSLLVVACVFILLPLLVSIVAPLKYSDSYLINKSLDKQKYIGGSSLNQKLYDYESQFGLKGNILTDYQYLGFLPGLEEYYEYGFPNSEFFIQQVNDPENAYVMVNSSNVTPEIADFIASLVESNKIDVIIEYGDTTMYSTCQGPCD